MPPTPPGAGGAVPAGSVVSDGRTARPLRVLAIDDEAPALDELVWLLKRDDRIGTVLPANSGEEALRVLHERQVDAIFMDVQMPGLTGLDLARVLSRFTTPPPVVFVTAHEQHAVDAFELNVVDYVLKPVRDERLAEAVRRVVRRIEGREPAAGSDDESIVVELGGVSRLVPRSEVLYVEAQGDYARLHTPSGSHLLRVPLSTLAEQWRDAGFVRIHRSFLVALAHITEWRTESGRYTLLVGGTELAVSRRHTRGLRDVLVRRAQPSHKGGS
ncbi:MAG: LytR/AlgR family response regulator transcription factor [Intrasporangium sp.]|uniref:LytR/AlgR family response regulator transcription factor n=1 Tax=Intrasporangium sp. TaxID=1925024 RepID=UPI003F7E9277